MPMTIRRAGVAALLVLPLSACGSLNFWEPREEEHCRNSLYKLAEWINAKEQPSPDETLMAKRSLEGRPVQTVTITYTQGATRKLITCTYAASGKGPVLDVIFEGVHLTDDDLSRLNKAVP